ncbi:unnamed protein product [Malassezia sympodialis ATCC 42132]|nr:uncharacterized protein MSY001_2008 [Malassezia sympodialis ATCC 42132]CCU99302.1 unnamed protein product [Malassezia sympodialis ATCC 42132]|eukprot:XP_018740557.1 uncharacterized protein MSY001_2008 [Malassezia sympodialis ATCC 42132]
MVPDDSDLIDAASVPACGETMRPSSPRAVRAPSLRLAHDLVPVSNRFWFGIFADTLPDADELNAGDGLHAAVLPADVPLSQQPTKLQWFCIDEDLVYLSFSNDWGPLNVAMFYRFCVHVHQMLIDPAMQDTHLALYTNTHPHHKANAALLCALYALTIDHISPADAFFPYSEMELMPFRDAGYGRADYCLTIQDILYGVRRALDCGLLDLTTFDLAAYEHYEQVQHGDWNWITPHFLALASPKDRAYMAALAAGGPAAASAAARAAARVAPNPMLRHTVDYFQEHKVGLVVRLNNPLYLRDVFENAGIEHLELYFDDGSNPSEDIVRTFIHEADRVIESGRAIAVHCKAGLGRTGVLIGAYLVWKHGFTASEVIGYMRLMRPGCVVGPQQHFMYEQAATWLRWGVEDRLRAELAKEPTLAPVPVPRTPAAPTPTTKPTPCVGQPRKSPSPKRRRVALGAATDSTPRVASDEHDAKAVAEQLESDTAPRTDAEVLGVVPRPAPDAPASPTATAAANAARLSETAHTPSRVRRVMTPAQPATTRVARSPTAKPVLARPAVRAVRPAGAENRPPAPRTARARPRP